MHNIQFQTETSPWACGVFPTCPMCVLGKGKIAPLTPRSIHIGRMSCVLMMCLYFQHNFKLLTQNECLKAVQLFVGAEKILLL